MKKQSVKKAVLVTLFVLFVGLALTGCSNRSCPHRHSCYGYSHHHHYGGGSYYSPVYQPHCGARAHVGYWQGGCGRYR